MAFARLNAFVNTVVQKMNGLVKKASVPTDEAAAAVDVDLKASKEAAVSKSERPPPKKSSVTKTPPKDDYGDDHSVPRNPRVADRLEDGENTESPTVRRKNTLKNILRPDLEMLERQTPPRNLEAFRSQVRIGEEILAIPKDEAKELFAKQAIVSGPWLKEEEEENRPRQKFVPKYPTSREPSTEHVGKSGVFERPAEPSPEPIQRSDPALAAAALPPSSLFERDPESGPDQFDVRKKPAKVETHFTEDLEEKMEEERRLAEKVEMER